MSSHEPPFGYAEAARRLGVKVTWLQAHIDEVPHRRLGRLVRFTQADLDTYLARQAVAPKTGGRSSRSRKRAA